MCIKYFWLDDWLSHLKDSENDWKLRFFEYETRLKNKKMYLERNADCPVLFLLRKMFLGYNGSDINQTLEDNQT